jgi:hypothetical protein
MVGKKLLLAPACSALAGHWPAIGRFTSPSQRNCTRRLQGLAASDPWHISCNLAFVDRRCRSRLPR